MLSHPLIVVGFPLLTSFALGLVVRAAEKRAHAELSGRRDPDERR